jgi:predicted GTPase
VKKRKVIIMGAAGRDFHDFNTFYRDNEAYEVVAFTSEAQNLTELKELPKRVYPPELAGKLYPNGIPIHSKDELEELIKKFDVDEVVLSYSDISHEYVMHRASRVLAAGADFKLIGPKTIQLKSIKPVIAVNAVRTGCGKSQTTRKIAELLKRHGKKVVVVREPMPYGNLKEQIVQRFASYEDMKKHKCTIEEMEEYEPHISAGTVVYAGVDYEKILREAEKEADIILWDGGNNELSFFKTDLLIVVADPFRVGHETTYHPGETNLLMADAVIINKTDTASKENIEKLKENIKRVNPKAKIIEAKSPPKLEDENVVKGKKVLVVEDGPTLTHGEMSIGAGFIAAKNAGASEIIDPRPFAVGTIQTTFKKYPHLERILPAMGYSEEQLKELEETINNSDAEVVIAGTPIDLGKIINSNKKIVRAKYDLEVNEKELEELLEKFL